MRFVVSNTDGKLKDGLRANIVIKMGDIKGVWLPEEAVQRVKDKDMVFVKTKEGFMPKKVKRLAVSKGRVLVEGLSEGEEVAISGTIFLKSQVEKC